MSRKQAVGLGELESRGCLEKRTLLSHAVPALYEALQYQ